MPPRPSALCFANVLALVAACSSSGAPPRANGVGADGGSPLPVADGGVDGDPASDVFDLGPDLETLRAKHGLPALAGAAYKDGVLVARGAVGVRKLGDETKVTASDAWHLGSCTKAMTALLVARFVEEGKLAWTDTLPVLLPDASAHASFASVTIEMLLQHRGGFPEVDADALWKDMWSSAERGEAAEITRKRVVYATLSSTAPATVGSFTYSNSGYMAAGVVLERISGKSWEALMKERVFAPLGMNGCGFGPAATPPAGVDQPWAHEESGAVLVPVAPDLYGDNPPSLGPAGTVHCPLEAWAKFLNDQLSGDKGGSALASPATYTRLHTPPVGGDYASGWNVVSRSWAGGVALNHSGSNTMNLVTTWLAPHKGLAMMVATNAATAGAEVAVDAAFAPMVERFAK